MPTMMPLTPMAKRLIIINSAIWFLVLVMGWFIEVVPIYKWFGFVPIKVINSFWVWQPISYMFLHSPNVFHLVFNMLLLWMLGSELEIYWGRRFFIFYYLGCGVGAALLYLLGGFVYGLITGNEKPLYESVVGASGAVFGLILAYGIVFGQRVVYFMMIFPMKARVFVMVIGGIEVLNLLSEGFNSKVANLAHLGGLVSGYLILTMGPRIREFMLRRQTKVHGRKLKLVVDNDRPQGGPKYWN